MTLKTCRYELYSISLTGKLLDFTRFVISLNLNWGLNASKASAKVSFSPEAKKQLMNVTVSYTHLTLPTTLHECRSRWSPYH